MDRQELVPLLVRTLEEVQAITEQGFREGQVSREVLRQVLTVVGATLRQIREAGPTPEATAGEP